MSKPHKNSLHGGVTISYLSPEELEDIRNRPKQKLPQSAPRRKANHTWPKSRKKEAD